MSAKKTSSILALLVLASLLFAGCGTTPKTVEPQATTGAQPTAAPTAGVQAKEVKNPDTFTSVLSSDVSSLDPHWQFDGTSTNISFSMYEKLIMFKGDSITEFDPILATQAPSVANGLIKTDADGSVRYTFPIRQGVKFHSGDLLTPEDIKYSVLRLIIQDRAGGGAYVIMPALTGGPSKIEDLAKKVAGAEKFEDVSAADLVKTFNILDERITVSGSSVEFHLPRPFGPFLTAIAGCWNTQIVSKKWCASQGEWPGTADTWAAFHNPTAADTKLYEKVNGTGPFKLVSWDRTSKEITMERFDDYWRGPAKVKRVVYKTVPEWTTRKLMLEAGDADMITATYPYLPQLQGIPGVRVEKGLPTVAMGALWFQWDIGAENNPAIGSGKLDGDGIPPDFFQDINVRKAFCYAFDYKTYLDQVWSGEAEQLRGPILKGMVGYRDDQPMYTYDPQKATEYFKKAYDGKLWDVGFKLTAYYITGSDNDKTALDILIERLLSINPKFRIDTATLQFSSFLGKLFGDMGMPLWACGLTADYPDGDNMATACLASDNFIVPAQGASAIALAKKEFDPLLEEARATTDPAKRAQIYDKVQRLNYDYAMSVYIELRAGLRVTRDWVQGLGWHPAGAPDSMAVNPWNVRKGY